MTSMLLDVQRVGSKQLNLDALKSEIRQALISQKSNACPIAMRMAWHASGTYDRRDGTGGSNGASMRYLPESDDPANEGLSIIRDLLLPVKKRYPNLSHADLYGYASVCAIEFLGGPKVPYNFGRTDDSNNSRCPANGRLPDASQGAKHLRQLFGERMGFSDQEIVALSGGHTLGRCHQVRSGFDGPWTTHPLRFDNEYYINLVSREWKTRKWDGPVQYEDVQTGKLMMLPTDLALIQDPSFRKYVEIYAADQSRFFKDFAEAYGKLIALGCPAECQPHWKGAAETAKDKVSAEFREQAMHGSVLPAKKLVKGGQVDVHQLEATSGRSALHKAAFWGHNEMVKYLINECKLNLNTQDNEGDTALHDAAKFGHTTVATLLVEAGADTTLKNRQGMDALAVAIEHTKPKIVELLKKNGMRRAKL